MQHNLWKLVALCGVVGVGVLVVVQAHRAMQPQTVAPEDGLVRNAADAGLEPSRDASDATEDATSLDPRTPLPDLTGGTPEGTELASASDFGPREAFSEPSVQPPPEQFEPPPDARPAAGQPASAAEAGGPFQADAPFAELADSEPPVGVATGEPPAAGDLLSRSDENDSRGGPAAASTTAGPRRGIPAFDGPDPFSTDTATGSPAAATESGGRDPIPTAGASASGLPQSAADEGRSGRALPLLELDGAGPSPHSSRPQSATDNGVEAGEPSRPLPPLPLPPRRESPAAEAEPLEFGPRTVARQPAVGADAVETTQPRGLPVPDTEKPEPAENPFGLDADAATAVARRPARRGEAALPHGPETKPDDGSETLPDIALSGFRKEHAPHSGATGTREKPHDFGSAAPVFAADAAGDGASEGTRSSLTKVPAAPPVEDTPFGATVSDRSPPLEAPGAITGAGRPDGGAGSSGVRTAEAGASDRTDSHPLQLVGGETATEQTPVPTFDVTPRDRGDGPPENAAPGIEPDVPRRLPPTDAAPLDVERGAVDPVGGSGALRPAVPSFGGDTAAKATVAERTVVTSEPLPGATSEGAGDATASKLPQLKLEKVAPEKAILGQPMIYAIIVRNVGTVPARQVVVEDEIPRGTKLEGTIPRAELAGNKLIWRLGTLDPEEQKKILVKVVPVQEGQVGSVATVSFVAEVATRTVVNAPKLKLVVEGPRAARVGQDVDLQFRVSNEGTAPATGVFLRNLVPDALSHPGGKDLEYEVGELKPGASETVTLTLKAVRPGEAVNRTIVTADGGLSAEVTHRIVVSGLQVELTRLGPQKRLLGRSVTFTNRLHNASDSATGRLTVREVLPDGVEFVSASAGGRFDERTRTVTWVVPDLPADASRELTLTVVPRTAGRLPFVVTVQDAFGNEKRLETHLETLGVPAVGAAFDRIDAVVAVGDTATVRLVVKNRGFGADTNVALRVQLPPQVQFVSAKGPTPHQFKDGVVAFAPLDQLPPGRQEVFVLTIKTQQPGNARLHAEVQSDRLARPVVVEETIAVFAEN